MHGVRVRVARLAAHRPRGARHGERRATRGEILRRELRDEVPGLDGGVREADAAGELVVRVANEWHQLPLRDRLVERVWREIERIAVALGEVVHLFDALLGSAEQLGLLGGALSMGGWRDRDERRRDGAKENGAAPGAAVHAMGGMSDVLHARS